MKAEKKRFAVKEGRTAKPRKAWESRKKKNGLRREEPKGSAKRVWSKEEKRLPAEEESTQGLFGEARVEGKKEKTVCVKRKTTTGSRQSGRFWKGWRKNGCREEQDKRKVGASGWKALKNKRKKTSPWNEGKKLQRSAMPWGSLKKKTGLPVWRAERKVSVADAESKTEQNVPTRMEEALNVKVSCSATSWLKSSLVLHKMSSPQNMTPCYFIFDTRKMPLELWELFFSGASNNCPNGPPSPLKNLQIEGNNSKN